MKNVLLFLFAFSFFPATAQKLVPGTYRYVKDQNEAKVTITGNELLLTAWQTEIKAKKVSDKRYENKESGTYLEATSDGKLVLRNVKHNLNEQLVLYSPENHKNTKPNVKQFTWNNNTYYAMEDKRPELSGTYKYQQGATWGDPKVKLADAGSYFQRHQVPPTPLRWWGLETNYKGEIQELKGTANGNSKMMLVVQYDDGTFDRMQVVLLPSEKKTVIMGERVLEW